MFYKALEGQIVDSRNGRVEAHEYKNIHYCDLDNPIPGNPKMKLSITQKEYLIKLFKSRKYESFDSLDKEVAKKDKENKSGVEEKKESTVLTKEK